MSIITKPLEREIIEDFVRLIEAKKLEGPKPTFAVIRFRNEAIDGIERKVYHIPIEYLRYRKYNGRILSDVLSYERNYCLLDEKDDETQKIIGNFLEEKDPKKSDTLKKSIKHSGQLEPAIITCDGFLINGNRRKMVFESLCNQDSEKFGLMKVVILPGPNDPGGPPTIKEIEQLENRYQLQKDGKSEYYGFDMALSIRKKIESGMTLREQLLDDAEFAHLPKKQFDKKIKEYKKEFLLPLECIDRYLKYLDREGLYDSISKGYGDREGRWQAFKDYSNFYNSSLKNKKWRVENKVYEDEIGDIEDVAFKIIRKRVIPNTKVHQVMRKMNKYMENCEAKKEMLMISDEIEFQLPDNERIDEETNIDLAPQELDMKWGAKYHEIFLRHINKSNDILDSKKEEESPMKLMKSAHQKLSHKNMDINNLAQKDIKEFMKFAEKVRDLADELKRNAYKKIKNDKI